MVEDGKITPYRFSIGGLTLWVHFASGLSFQAVSPVLPLISGDYDISHASASLLVGAVAISSGVFAMPGAILVGRVGVRRTYTVSWIMIGLLTLSALSPSFGGLLALRIVFGLGLGAIMPATGPLLMQWFRPRELPIVTSLNIASMSLGMVVAAATAAPLAEVMGWERVLGLFGGIALAGAFAWLLWGKAQQHTGAMTPTIAWREIGAVLRNRTILLLGAADAACFSMYIVLSGWLPTFYNETRGISLTEAGFITSLLPFMGIFAVLLAGFLSLKIRPKRLFLIVAGAMAGVGALGSFLIDDTAVTYAAVMLFGLGAWLYVPTLLTLPMELPSMTPQRVAVAWAWILMASSTGAFIAPLVVGAMRDAMDTFIPGFLIFAGLAWFLFVAGFLLPKTAVQREPVPDAPVPPSSGQG